MMVMGARGGMETMIMRMTQIMHALKNNDNESKYMYLYPKVMQCTVGEIRVFCPMGVLGVFI